MCVAMCTVGPRGCLAAEGHPDRYDELTECPPLSFSKGLSHTCAAPANKKSPPHDQLSVPFTSTHDTPQNSAKHPLSLECGGNQRAHLTTNSPHRSHLRQRSANIRRSHLPLEPPGARLLLTLTLLPLLASHVVRRPPGTKQAYQTQLYALISCSLHCCFVSGPHPQNWLWGRRGCRT